MKRLQKVEYTYIGHENLVARVKEILLIKRILDGEGDKVLDEILLERLQKESDWSWFVRQGAP